MFVLCFVFSQTYFLKRIASLATATSAYSYTYSIYQKWKSLWDITVPYSPSESFNSSSKTKKNSQLGQSKIKLYQNIYIQMQLKIAIDHPTEED